MVTIESVLARPDVEIVGGEIITGIGRARRVIGTFVGGVLNLTVEGRELMTDVMEVVDVAEEFKPLTAMNREQLLRYAKVHGIDVEGKRSIASLRAAIREHGQDLSDDG